jgi:hypothetical protein
MLKADAKPSHKKREEIDVAFMCVPWDASALIRFSETLQIIDVLDCLEAVYGSSNSANVAKSKYFGSGLRDTETKLGCPASKLLWDAKWKAAPRVRVAIGVKHMHDFMTTMIPHMARSAELASKLGVECLTVRNCNPECNSESAAVPAEAATLCDSVPPKNDDTSVRVLGASVPKRGIDGQLLITDKMMELGDRRLAVQVVDRRLAADVAESAAREAESSKRAKMANHDQQMADVELQAKKWIEGNRIKRLDASEAKIQEYRSLAAKIKALREIGDEEAAMKFKRELLEM